MKLSLHEVEGVAHLSRLELTCEELGRFTDQINTLLDHFARLQELDTEGVEPTSHAIPVYNVFRKDEVKPSLAVEDVVSNGPSVADNCFVVPRVVET